MTNRSQAKRITLGAQAASLVLAVAAVGVAALGLPVGEQRAFEPVEVSLAAPSAGANAQDTDNDVPDHRVVDFAGIVERFEQIGNAPTGAEPITGAGKGPDDPGPTLDSDEIRYLGMVQIGSRRSAMLVIDGKQRIVAQGRKTTNSAGSPVSVLRVQPEFVEIRVGDEVRESGDSEESLRIDKGERTTAAFTSIERTEESVRRANDRARGEAESAATGRGANNRIVNEDGSENPRVDFERRRRDAIDRALDEGRITQEEAQRMLDRMNNSTPRRGRDD